MAALNAAELISGAKLIVIKIGSALLVQADTGGVRSDWLHALAKDVAALKATGTGVILVSSGSIALGRRVLNLNGSTLSLEQSQASASVGQIRLAQAYQNALEPHGIVAAQVLVTLEDSENRRRYLNSRATLAALLENGAVPIVNENDTVATDEIRYGDNDRLAAQVASLAGADLLVLLSDVDGLYTADPREEADAAHIPNVDEITVNMENSAGGVGSEGAKGGMKTKLMAARIAMKAGCAMVIAKGATNRPLYRLQNGEMCTVFQAAGDPSTARKRWISAMKPKGRIFVDKGAIAALQKGRSLLPAGVTSIEGNFERGDPVEIAGPDGVALAKALAGYDIAEARAIIGHHSAEIETVLGHPGRAALVHRDDMAI